MNSIIFGVQHIIFVIPISLRFHLNIFLMQKCRVFIVLKNDFYKNV